MKTAAYIAVIAAAIPAVWSLPADLPPKPFLVPSCGAETCLTNQTFVSTSASKSIAPSDLAGLCSLPQDDVTRYVQTVQPCIDGEAGKEACTEGAIVQYKTLLKTECAKPAFNKQVEWA